MYGNIAGGGVETTSPLSQLLNSRLQTQTKREMMQWEPIDTQHVYII